MIALRSFYLLAALHLSRRRTAAEMARTCRDARHGHEDDRPRCPPSIRARPTSPARRCSRASARTITRSRPRTRETQRLFDQGVHLLFGFNHAEAIRSFREAARLDPRLRHVLVGRGVRARPQHQPADAARRRRARLAGAAEGARARSAMRPPEERAGSTRWPRAIRTDPKADRANARRGLCAGDGQALGRNIRTISTPAPSMPRR